MIKKVKDFMLKGPDVYNTIRNVPPNYMEVDGYELVDEIQEEDRLYRKATIRSKSSINMLPKIIRDQLPDALVRTSESITEESIYYDKEKKIQFSMCSDVNDAYTMTGTIRFIDLDEDTCKVVVLLYVDIDNLRQHVSNKQMLSLVLPIVEKKIPEYYVDQLRDVYTDIIGKQS